MPPTDPTPSVTADQLTRALGEAVIRIWSNFPQDVQLHLFQEVVTSHGESIRAQLAVFLHDKHPRTSDPLGNPREMTEPDSLGLARLPADGPCRTFAGPRRPRCEAFQGTSAARRTAAKAAHQPNASMQKSLRGCARFVTCRW